MRSARDERPVVRSPVDPDRSGQWRGEGLPGAPHFCVGRNYAAHAAEMGFEVDREAPFYFTKSAFTLQPSETEIPYPPGTENFHYEMELVLAIGKPVFKAERDEAMGAIYGYACGLDMTRRDLQIASRAKQRPWDFGKDVEQSAVVTAITKASDFGMVGAAHTP
jgi:fumarylpyruvate hydrolase